jgi:hypothetical protein
MLRQYFAHQGPNIVVAGQAIHRQSNLQQQPAEALVGFPCIVLDQVAGDQRDVRRPCGVPVMRENPLEGLVRDAAAQLASRDRKQVWIRQVQDPERAVAVVAVQYR